MLGNIFLTHEVSRRLEPISRERRRLERLKPQSRHWRTWVHALPSTRRHMIEPCFILSKACRAALTGLPGTWQDTIDVRRRWSRDRVLPILFET